MRQHRRVLAGIVACKGGVASQMYRFLAYEQLQPQRARCSHFAQGSISLSPVILLLPSGTGGS